MKPMMITAAIDIPKPSAGELRKFNITAYTGGKLHVPGFQFPVVIDLSGLDVRAGLPILIRHENAIEATLGQATDFVNDGRQLMLSGNVTGTSAAVQTVLAMADRGHQWEASVGAVTEEEDRSFVDHGQIVAVNGRRLQGPFILARKSVLRETSVLPMGADPSTSVNLAAAAANLLKGSAMPTFEEWVGTLGLDPAQISEELKAILMASYSQTGADAPSAPAAGSAAGPATVGAALAIPSRVNAARLDEISRICVNNPEMIQAALRNGWTAEQTELQLLRAQNRSRAPISHPVGGGSSFDRSSVITASLALNLGCNPDRLAQSYGEGGQRVVDAAMSLQNRGATFRTVMDHCLQMAGRHSPSHRMTTDYIRAAFEANDSMIRAGYSGGSLTQIFSDSANKVMLDAFEAVPTVWREFCVVSSLKDFKPTTKVRLFVKGDFAEMPRGATFDHFNLSEEGFEIQAKSYGSMLQVSYQDMIDDDLGTLKTVPSIIGRKAAIRVEKTVFQVLMAAIGVDFTTANSSLITGTTSALSIASLKAAKVTFRNRTDPNGDPLMLEPELVLTGPTLEDKANQLNRDTQVVAVGVTSGAQQTIESGNPHAGKFTPIQSPWIENANITNYTSTGWGLMARPQGQAGLIEVGFLNGNESPRVITADADINTLGIVMRGDYHFGVAVQDPRFVVWNTGVSA